MPDVTIKAPPEVLDEFAGITGLLPLSPSAGGSVNPLAPPASGLPMGTGAPDVGAAPLPSIQAPQSDTPAPIPPVGSVDYAQQVAQQHAERKLPGVLGKIGGWASSILTPNVAAMIPQTPLGRIVEQRRDLGNLQQAEAEQRAEDTARSEEALRGAQAEAMGTLVPVKIGDQTFYLHEKDAANVIGKQIQGGATVEAAGERGQASRDVETTKSQTAKDIEAGRETAAKDIAAGKSQTAKDIEAGREQTQREIAKLRTDTSKLINNEKIQATNDPHKLTTQMKTMKQQAQSVLPELDNALAETDRVAGQLGPSAGRWNDFWQGKVGASDPAYAYYKDEISFISTAITLAHARGRMSNELFEHFQKMFDAGKQSSENMKQALEVAKEWMTNYAIMGEQGSSVGGGGGKNTPPPNAKIRDFTDIK